MSTALPLPTTSNGKGSALGKTALVFAGLTVVLPVAIALFTGYELNHNEEANKSGWGGLAILLIGMMGAVVVAGFTSLIGSVTGGLSLARGESGRWRAFVGLFVNFPVLMFVAYLFVVFGMNGR